MTQVTLIQSNIPLPKRSHTSGTRPRKYPFEHIQVGQMFFIPGKERNTLHTYFSSVAKKMGIKVSSRMVHMLRTDEGWQMCSPGDDGAVLGIGVWRIA